MTRLIKVAPGRWRVARKKTPAARSDMPLPNVISDAMPAIEQVDGKFYESKSAFRAVGRANGLTEVGNEKGKPRSRKEGLGVQIARREAIAKAWTQFTNGRRPQRS